MPPSDNSSAPSYCGFCGGELTPGELTAGELTAGELTAGELTAGNSVAGDHARCAARLELEPPRYCSICRRRMIVQVVPTGWSATCSRHGVTTSQQPPVSNPDLAESGKLG